MDDDYGDYLYDKRKDAKLDRMHDLMAENQRLRDDQRRLEWCASNQVEFYRDDPYWIVRWIDPQGDWNAEQESAMAKDWREAIDEAMEDSND
jgi:hypothetical protein